MSRLIWSRAELERDAASNDGTCCFRTPLPDSSILGVAAALEPDASFEALFRWFACGPAGNEGDMMTLPSESLCFFK